MKIQPITHKTLAETVAGKLAASLLDGSLRPGTQLPPERDLMNQLGVSRATLREALKALGRIQVDRIPPECRLVCARHRRSQMLTKARELASAADNSRPALRPRTSRPPVRSASRLPPKNRSTSPTCTPTGLGTFEFISWWEREKVQNANVLVVGAGALGNDVIKNLALMGVGYILHRRFRHDRGCQPEPFGAIPRIR